MEKAELSKGLDGSRLADSCQFGVNDAGTCEKSDTGLTQPRSGFDLPKVRRLLSSYKPPPELKPHIDTLKKQLSNYEKYRESGGEYALMMLRTHMIPATIRAIEAKL